MATGRFRPECLFAPRSVAVIGADRPEGRAVLANLRAGGFAGPVLAVTDISELTEPPDLAVVCCAPSTIAAAFAALEQLGTFAAIVPGAASGLQALARATGVRSLGPGSFGVAAPAIGLNASRAHLTPGKGRLALVSQSGAMCRAVLDWAGPNGVGFSHIIGIGGNDDIGFGMVLDWLARDPGTGAILLDIRRIKDARVFLSAARAAARLRPMVAMRAGGRLMDPSGAADAAFTAALRRAGVLCVDTLQDMLAAAETLTRARPVRSEALAIVSNALGPARLAADAALRDGLTLAALSPETRMVLDMLLPDSGAAPPDKQLMAGGEVVYVGAADPLKLAEVGAMLAGAREVGGVLVVHAPSGPDDAVCVQAIGAAAGAIRVPLLVCAMGETTGAAHRQRLGAAGVPVFAVPEQAVRGFLHLVQDRRNRAAARELPSSTVLALAPDQPAVRRLFTAARDAGRLTLAQDEALGVLSAYGVATVPGRAVADADEAVAAADALGYPVVLKRRRLSRQASDGRRGLMLDLRDAAQLRAAAGLLAQRDTPGLLVQPQLGRARELLIRVTEDPLLGPIIGFGQGGTAADILLDVAVDLPPLNVSLAHALVARTRVAATLGELPDQPAANVEAIADALVRVSQLIVDFPEIAELELNPLFVDAKGVMAADAWIRLRAAGAIPARLAIPPYPAEWSAPFEARGDTLLIRPIRPEDAQAHAAFFARLSPEDVRYRFFSAMREMSPELMARMTQVDYEREIAFIAVREATGETVGVSRLVREGSFGDGEFAVVVQPDMKGHGLGGHLMGRLIAWGRAQGMAEIVGQVLADNQPMLAFVRRLGFTIRRPLDDPEVVEARLTL